MDPRQHARVCRRHFAPARCLGRWFDLRPGHEVGHDSGQAQHTAVFIQQQGRRYGDSPSMQELQRTEFTGRFVVSFFVVFRIITAQDNLSRWFVRTFDTQQLGEIGITALQ